MASRTRKECKLPLVSNPHTYERPGLRLLLLLTQSRRDARVAGRDPRCVMEGQFDTRSDLHIQDEARAHGCPEPTFEVTGLVNATFSPAPKLRAQAEAHEQSAAEGVVFLVLMDQFQ